MKHNAALSESCQQVMPSNLRPIDKRKMVDLPLAATGRLTNWKYASKLDISSASRPISPKTAIKC
eukprot:gene3795-8372_t